MRVFPDHLQHAALSPLPPYPCIEVKLRLSEPFHVHVVFSPTNGYQKSV